MTHSLHKHHALPRAHADLYKAETAQVFAAPEAQVFTSLSSFLLAEGRPSYSETFESVPVPKDAAVGPFTQHGITYTGIFPGPGNVFISSPGYDNFGAGLNPTTSSILTANGDEHFLIEFAQPVFALGFNVFYNGLGPSISQFFEGDTLVGRILDAGDAKLGYSGFIPAPGEFVTSATFETVNGGILNTGIDNLSIFEKPLDP